MKKFLLILSIAILAGCQDKAKVSMPEVNDIRIEINVCDPPYNAVPDDTIPDTEAFQLAMDVMKSLKSNNIFNKISPVLIVPPGDYIIDKSLKNDRVTMELPPRFACFNLRGVGTSVSNMNIYMRY